MSEAPSRRRATRSARAPQARLQGDRVPSGARSSRWPETSDSESSRHLDSALFRCDHAAMGKLARQKHQKKDHRESESRPLEPFRVIPHDFGFDPKIDLDKMNALADELAAIDDTRKLGK